MNTVSVSTPTLSVSERVKAVAAALVIGVALIYTTGFAASTNVHNAAHDTRHGSILTQPAAATAPAGSSACSAASSSRIARDSARWSCATLSSVHE